jgi:DNA recombination protein RmuC
MESLALALLGAAALLALALVRRRADPAPAQTLEVVCRSLGQLQSDLRRVVVVQDELRREVQRGREASLTGLSEASQALQGQIGQAQRALVEVRAIEEGRARQLDRATDSLRRLEAVLAGSSSRGAAGENILARALDQLPPDLLASNVCFGSRVVEYALVLPGGRYLPIDSKWTSAASLEALETEDDPERRRRLLEHLARDLRQKVREMVKYLDPERTVSLALLAVPDAVHAATTEAHGEGWREGVLVVPYSLALPYVLALYRLSLRFGSLADGDAQAARLCTLAESLRRFDEEVEGRLSRSLVQLMNARDSLRGHASEARGAAERLLRPEELRSSPPLALPARD